MARAAAITGATGFIGWHLACRLRDSGWEVRAIVRPETTRPLPTGITRVAVPLTSGELLAVCDGVDTIFHLAATLHARSRPAFDAVNVEATRHLATVAARVGARLVHVSSLGAAGPSSASHPRSETQPCAPVNAYGQSKLAGEHVVREFGSGWTILRPTLVYGPRDRLFLPLFRLASRGRFFRLPGSPSYNLIHVDDVVRALACAANNDAARGETLFIGHPTNVADDVILQTLARVYGRSYRPYHPPRLVLHFAALAGEVASRFGASRMLDNDRLAELSASGFCCTVDRARDVLGFEARIGIEEGFASLAAWYRETGWIS